MSIISSKIRDGIPVELAIEMQRRKFCEPMFKSSGQKHKKEYLDSSQHCKPNVKIGLVEAVFQSIEKIHIAIGGIQRNSAHSLRNNVEKLSAPGSLVMSRFRKTENKLCCI